MPAFWVKLGANDVNCVDVPLYPTHSLTHVWRTHRTWNKSEKLAIYIKIEGIIIIRQRH